MANVPAAPGTVPIPDDHVRLFHYTRGDAQDVLKQGLLMSHAKGESYGEPSVIWASARMPENSLYAGNPVVEFSVPYNDPRWLIGRMEPGVKYNPQIDSNDPGQVPAYVRNLHDRGSHVTFGGDIDPSEIIAVHEPWHSHYRYFEDNDLDPNDYQWLKENPERTPDEAKALMEYEKMKVHTHWKSTWVEVAQIPRLSGFRYLTADIEEKRNQNTEQAKKQLSEYFANDKQGERMYNLALQLIMMIPAEGYKLIPWTVREITKRQLLHHDDGAQNVQMGQTSWGHARDILTQAAKWFDWSREHNKPLPEFNRKDFGFSELEGWVYEMNNSQNEEQSAWTDSTPVYKWEDGWTMDKVGPKDLAREGELMGHCVGGYCDIVTSGRSSIFSLRDPKGHPHVTIEVDGDFNGTEKARKTPGSMMDYPQLTVIQVQGKSDTEPIPEYQEYVDDWFETLRTNGWDVEVQDPEREPEYEYNDHVEGPMSFDDPDDWLKYNDIMKDRYDAQYHFADDEDPQPDDYRNNVWNYQNPRRLELPQTAQEWAQHAQDFIQGWQKGEYSDEDAVNMVHSMWLALLHSQADNQYNTMSWSSGYGQDGIYEKERKEFWNLLIRALERKTTGVKQPQRIKQPTLFDPTKLDDPANYQTREAKQFIELMMRMENVPAQWDEPQMRQVRNEDNQLLYKHRETGEEVTRPHNYDEADSQDKGPHHRIMEPDIDPATGQQRTMKRYLQFPGEGYTPSDYNQHFTQHGADYLSDLTPHPWTAVSTWKMSEIEQRPDHNYEVGDHVLLMVDDTGHGGLPNQKNWKGQEGQVTEVFDDGWIAVRVGDERSPELFTAAEIMPAVGVSGEAWPDTLPWSEQEQEYYRTSRAWWLPNKTAADIADLAEKARQNLWQREDMAKMLQTTQQVEAELGYGPEDGPPSQEDLKGLELAVGAYKRNKDWNTWGSGGIAETLRTQYGYSEDSIKKYVEAAPKVLPVWDEYIRGELFKNFLYHLQLNYPGSYKIWPWAIKRLKNVLKDATPYYDEYITEWRNWAHYADIVGQAGELLNTLRQENRTPADFDINQIQDFEGLEGWMNAYRKENVGEQWEKRDVVYKSPEGWTIENVTTQNDLNREGELMGHCVGGYCKLVTDGKTLIYSLRDSKGAPHATIEYRPVYEQTNEDGTPVNPDLNQWIHENPIARYEIQQIQGKQNGPPKPEYRAQIKEFNNWLQSQGYTVKWANQAWRRAEDNDVQRSELRAQNTYHLNSIDDLKRLVADYHANQGTQHFTEQHPNLQDEYGIETESGVPQRWLNIGELRNVTNEIIDQVYAGLDPSVEQEYAVDLITAWYSLMSQPYASSNGPYAGAQRPKSVVDARTWLNNEINTWQTNYVKVINEQAQNDPSGGMRIRQMAMEGLQRVVQFNNMITMTNGTQWQQAVMPGVPREYPNSWNPELPKEQVNWKLHTDEQMNEFNQSREPGTLRRTQFSSWKPVGTLVRRLGFFKIAPDINELAQRAIQNLEKRQDLMVMQAPYIDNQGNPWTKENIQQQLGLGLQEPTLEQMFSVGYQDNPKYNPEQYRAIMNMLTYLPPELFKFFPWVVKQIKSAGNVNPFINRQHARDILTQAWQHMEYLRSQPSNSPNAAPIPDINQLDFPALEAWVYQRNSTGIDVRPGTEWEYNEGYPKYPNSVGENPTEYPSELQKQKYDLGDGYEMVPVFTEADLKREGDMMGHCVGGYCRNVAAGDSFIFSLRDAKGEPHVTVELEPDHSEGGYKLVQVQGKQNKTPDVKYATKVKQWFDQIKGHYDIHSNIEASGLYDLDDYEYTTQDAETYGIPQTVNVDLNSIVHDLVETMAANSSSEYGYIDTLNEWADKNIIDRRDLSDELAYYAKQSLEDKERELRDRWQEDRGDFEDEYANYVQEVEGEADDEESEHYGEEPDDFERWLYNNYPHEVDRFAEEPDFEMEAEDELPEVADLYRDNATSRRSSWKLAGFGPGDEGFLLKQPDKTTYGRIPFLVNSEGNWRIGDPGSFHEQVFVQNRNDHSFIHPAEGMMSLGQGDINFIVGDNGVVQNLQVNNPYPGSSKQYVDQVDPHQLELAAREKIQDWFSQTHHASWKFSTPEPKFHDGELIVVRGGEDDGIAARILGEGEYDHAVRENYYLLNFGGGDSSYAWESSLVPVNEWGDPRSIRSFPQSKVAATINLLTADQARQTVADPNMVYHGTTQANADAILSEGVIRQADDGRGHIAAWFASDPTAAAFRGDVVLVVPRALLGTPSVDRLGVVGVDHDVHISRTSADTPPMYFDDIWRYRVPFLALPNGTHEMGFPGDEHHDMEERLWFKRQLPEGMHESDMQGHVIFHPEYGEVAMFPDWLKDEDYQNTLRHKARGMYDAHVLDPEWKLQPRKMVEGKVAIMTIPQQQRAWEAQGANPKVVHEFPNGWTVRQAQSPEDVAAIGTLCRNCWQDYETHFETDPNSVYYFGEPSWYALFNTYDLPVIAFYVQPKQGKQTILDALGPRNRDITPDEHQMLQEFADANGYVMGHQQVYRPEDAYTEVLRERDGLDLQPLHSSWKLYSASAIPADYSNPSDPLDLQGKQPVFNNMQYDWLNLPDTEQQQAIVNAFRATMLSPRLKLRDNAIMYQEMMAIPYNESDPDVFEDHARAVKTKWDRQGQGDLMGEIEPMAVDQQVPGKLTPGFWTNVRRLSALGPYADELRDAAVTDMEEFGGSGRYFREQILKLGIPGVGPKVASFAWLALNPKGSDLGTLDVWMMRHLNQEADSPNTPAHYFELEDQLRDEKDALYGKDTPLGQYQWGVWDKLRTPGLHQDHSPLRVYNPTPYTQVSWGDFARAPRPKVAPEQHPDQEQLFANAK